MGIPIRDETLYTLLFADDQVIVASNMDDANYMLRKLIEEYERWGLTINVSKTEYLAIGENDLNFVLWNDKITKKTKHMIYQSIVESIITYGSEIWVLNKRDRDRLLALEMDYWRRSNGTSRLEHVRNEQIRQDMKVDKTIIDTIETKRLL
ncbi:hypothetical protein RN001_013170 [Aquatica leii]|uniref:Reverse transcriptase domain-containing protein n=1 Tax=Aquatica leii TaxID=1421715 RepID=A0AAN7SNM1_9COLE|nr:hypothetical protein RN001_013170 [Aquatica leii]